MRLTHPVCTVFAYLVLMTLTSVKSRSFRTVESQNNHRLSNGHKNIESLKSENESHDDRSQHRKSHYRKTSRGQMSSEEESEEYDRHAYVMSTDHLKPTPIDSEHQTLHEAFQQHMNPTNKMPHDIYAYKLPSDLWFIVRYKKNSQGVIDKYMSVVSSFTKYLDKMDSTTKSVSVNVNGVETVFRLTSKT